MANGRMMGSMELRRLDDTRWEIPRSGDMRVPGLIFASEPLMVKAAASGSSGATQSYDLTGLVEGEDHRATIRHSSGLPFETADGQDFKTLYGYKENYRYSLTEGSFQGKQNSIRYGGGYTHTSNVSFPYLLMDEIYNTSANGFFSYMGNKLYFNYTDHLMDNSLRVSTMSMSTHARNLTAGLLGNFYELTYRLWDADNNIVTPMTSIQNKLMPSVSILALKVQQTFSLAPLTIRASIGGQYNAIGDESRLGFYYPLYPDASRTRWFISFSTVIQSVTTLGKDWYLGGILDLSTDAPETEFLYVAVRKPMGKPLWTGNPVLDQPIRATLRSNLNHGQTAQLERYGSYVWNYVYLTDRTVNAVKYTTYKNIKALLLGFNVSMDWDYLDLAIAYTWGQDLDTHSPLAEIVPVRLEGTLGSPEFSGLSALLRATYHARQGRVDTELNESPTESWYRIDLALDYQFASVKILFEVENLTNQLFTQHLSYVRNPFSSGNRVIEPGRTFRLSIRYFGQF